MIPTDIPDIVIGRLPIYLRELDRLAQAGIQMTSSQELGRRVGLRPAQIRKDLSHFGEFGRQGAGYEIEYLRGQLRQIVKADRLWSVALVGAGDLGRALAHYDGFKKCGFRITLVVDNDPAKIGQAVNGLVIHPATRLRELVTQHALQVAMVAVPAEAAQSVTNELIAGGVRGLLNYAPIHLEVPPDVQVQHIDPAIHLQHMTYYIRG